MASLPLLYLKAKSSSQQAMFTNTEVPVIRSWGRLMEELALPSQEQNKLSPIVLNKQSGPSSFSMKVQSESSDI